ncbi:MAG TPA: hypothetical protein VFH92_07800 [Phenylobacterium sp.]|nr:hypothetical protein [Phenylobacterium sp.]
MTPDPAAVDPAEAMLAELAGLDLTLARHVHACAMATDDKTEVVELSRAYQGVARSLRQTLALRAQLKRDRAAAAKADPAPAAPIDWVRVRRRQDQLRAAVCRVIWDETESESEDEATLLDVLQEELRRGQRDPGFGAQPLDAHVLETCAIMNLPLEKAERWRDLPDLSADRPLRPYDEVEVGVDEALDGPLLPHGANGHGEGWRSSA